VLLALVVVGGGWIGALRWLGPRVPAVQPARREVVQTVVASGRVLPPAEINLGTMLSGIVRAVHVREGDRVTAGQVLVEFDDEELLAQVAQARAGVLQASARIGQIRRVGARVAGESARQAQANLLVAQTQLARQESLYASGAIALADLENARRTLDVARSQAQSAELTAAGSAHDGAEVQLASAGRALAEAALRAAQARLAQARVRAPSAGVIIDRQVEPGDVVGPARTLLVLLGDGPTEIQVAPDERNLAYLQPGQSALASAEAFPDQQFPAELTYLAPTIDARRGTIEVRLRVPSPPAYLRPDMTVSVEILVGRSARALTVPPVAVHDASTRSPWVMTVDAGGRTARRPVRLGLRGDTLVEVLQGLREDETVLTTTGGPPLAIGRRVRPRLPAVRRDGT
jgi:HlyD family secretion protein